MNVKADQLPVYKAIVVVIIVTLQSDVFKKYIAGLKAKKECGSRRRSEVMKANGMQKKKNDRKRLPASDNYRIIRSNVYRRYDHLC